MPYQLPDVLPLIVFVLPTLYVSNIGIKIATPPILIQFKPPTSEHFHGYNNNRLVHSDGVNLIRGHVFGAPTPHDQISFDCDLAARVVLTTSPDFQPDMLDIGDGT